ncbi:MULTISPECIES: CoA transferase [unclassified Rhodococcus (in: high G+C Gram-positive bacteria)]|uniref:CoA transferase n=1 Tax=unclassified Rhodococcus (in: high G+C Gram-positive bacteria) TaxID=192944 RepID=UPI001639A0C6|nr:MULTISPECIES: CoA transferase [unclassified Rhodococcus (in: high G+C Gram-positive bacteria)]MBC2640186.1 CoA transferase [Rhodococcus sp. 3A]MBC2895067.1 CoA transferase [Rhodococcus sp. 4CII]
MTRPLDGIHVVSLAINLPGPLAAARLHHQGARVTKVESPSGDPLEAVAPAWYSHLTADQEVTVLDLKDPAGRSRLDVLLDAADFLITAMRPSALHRLGLAEVTTTFPRLGHIEIVGYDGAQEESPGHDLNYQAVHGTLTPPAMPTVPVADMLGAERVVTAAALALLDRARTGSAGHRRVVLDDAAADAGAAVRHGLMGPGAPLGGAVATYGIYASADGYVALGALEPHFAARVKESLDIEPTHEHLSRVFAERPTSHWEALAEEADIPLNAVLAPKPLVGAGPNTSRERQS